jgi:competence protein ComGF
MTRELPEGSVYNRIDDFQGPWRSRSHTDRKLENEWQQSALNNLMQYASSSGLGTWDPLTVDTNYGTAWRDRSHTDRKIENEMQQAAITNLQNWLVDVGKHQEQTAADARAALAETKPDTDKFAPQEIDLSKYLTKDELAKHESNWAAQHQSELLAAQQQWQADSAAALQQAQTSWADQYAASLQQAKSDWSKEFTSAEQQWAETAAKEQQDIRSSLLDDFKTQTAAKDRVYETQIDELKSLYAEQESDWKDQANLYEQVLADQKTSWDTQIKDQANLYAQQQAQQQAGWDEQAGVYESTIGSQQSAIDDFKTQLTDFRDTIKGQQATIGEIEAERAHQEGQIKAYQERDIQDAERARIAATYGQTGKPMNQAVKGVRTQNELPQSTPKFTSSFFGRSGNRIKNTSLNIA